MAPESVPPKLGLDERQIRERAEFFASYASAAEKYPEVDVDAYEQANGDQAGLRALDEKLGVRGNDFEPLELVWAEKHSWARDGERADALREAAAAMLLVDPDRTRELLKEAAAFYDGSASSYALFLRALSDSTPSVENAFQAGQMLAETYGQSSERRDEKSDDRIRPAADDTPGQTIYLLLLVGTSPEVSREYAAVIESAEISPPATSATSFGAAGVALAQWWRFAIELCAPRNAVKREAIIMKLAELSRPHGERLRVARLDGYHWRRLGGRGELVDLDLAGAAQFASRRLEADDERPLQAKDFADLPELAQVSLVAGLELGPGQTMVA